MNGDFFNDLFRFFSLALIGAMVFTVVTNGSQASQLVSSGFGGANDTVRAVEGK